MGCKENVADRLRLKLFPYCFGDGLECSVQQSAMKKGIDKLAFGRTPISMHAAHFHLCKPHSTSY